ncbi:MAG: hypothetical protein F6K28_15975 [Microcoleus sp. SIO2G3]|nr:hypothetical protein [Microcoleus sp. SIO2G3]
MKFIQYEEYRINPEAIDYYSFTGDELRVYFRSEHSLYFKGDDAAVLVKLLDAAIALNRGWMK